MRRSTFVALMGILASMSIARAQSATRDLPDHYRAGGPAVTVSISLSGTGGLAAAGVEDKPPADWIVSNISNGGSFDANSVKVKWGPFFSPSIPGVLTYDVLPSPASSGEACFAGTASFDGLDEPIAGELCIPPPVPAASSWGLLALALGVFIAGSVLVQQRSGRFARED